MMGTLRITARKLLGRRGTFLLRNVLSEICFRLGLILPSSRLGRDECISAMVCTYNDPDWLEPSLLSIKDLVHEYVIVDSSTDETPQIIEGLRREHSLNIRMFRVPPGDLVKARNLALERSSCKWVLHWDSDFIAKEEMNSVIEELLDKLDRNKYYLVYWPHVTLCGDPYHLCSNPLHIEHWLFTWSPKLVYRWVGRYDSLIAPLKMYKAVFINKPLSIHMRAVRRPDRYAFKAIWWRFREEFNKLGMSGATHEELWSLAHRKAREVYGTDNLYELGIKLLRDTVSKLKPYDNNLYGPLPQILVEYLKKHNWFTYT